MKFLSLAKLNKLFRFVVVPCISTLSLLHADDPLHEEAGKIIDLETYVTTGTRTERIVSEAPVKTELVLQQDFERYNIHSFQEALKLIPTARFENDCQNCGLNQIQLLGLSTDYTSILFDGAPLYSGLARVYGADLFPSIFIDRIEVVKGGSSVLYGPEAIAGVVNLITERPQFSGLNVRLQYENVLGDAGQVESSIIADYVDNGRDLAVSLYSYYRDREGQDLGRDGFTEIAEFYNKVIGGQLYWNPAKNTLFKGSFQYMDQNHRGGDQLDQPEAFARVSESLYHEITQFNFEWHQQWSDSVESELRYSRIDITRESFYGARGDAEQGAYEAAGFDGEVTAAFIAAHQEAIHGFANLTWGLTENTVDYLDFQVDHQMGSHTVSYGIQYRMEDLEDGSLYNQEVPKTQDDFANLGFFVQDQWEVSQKLELVPGVRFDDHDNIDDSIFSPRLAARYFASSELTLRASWSTGFNAPGAFNEDKHIGVNQGGAIFLVNAEDLEEEKSQTISVGFEYQPEYLNDQMIFHSQIHYTTLEDAFDIDDSGSISGDENLWLRINGSDSTIWVWENNVNWQLTPHLRLDAGLSYIDATYDEPVERATGLKTDEYIKRPDWAGHVGLTAETEFANLNALLSYTGSMLAVGEDADIWRETPNFWVLDLGVRKVFSQFIGEADLVLSVGVENAFDERQKDFMDNGEDRDPTYLYGPTQPRTYYLSAQVVW